MSKKQELSTSHSVPAMVRLISKRPGDIIIKSGKRFECDKCVLVTEDEAIELEQIAGEFVKRVD